MTIKQDLQVLANYAIGDESLDDMIRELRRDKVSKREARAHAKEHISMIAHRVLYGVKEANKEINDVLEEYYE